jgi:hypothetical protein
MKSVAQLRRLLHGRLQGHGRRMKRSQGSENYSGQTKVPPETPVPRRPLYSGKRTLLNATRMSALCHKQTFCAAAETVAIRSPRRQKRAVMTAKATISSRRLSKNGSVATIRPPAFSSVRLANAGAKSLSVFAFTITIRFPRVTAACRTSCCSGSAFGFSGLRRTPSTAALGINTLRRPRRFAPKPLETRLTPVRLPPGLLMLVTRPK